MAFRLRNFEKILYVKEILVVGQFEIKSIKKKELVPDVIELSVYAGVENNNVLDNDKSILEAQNNLKEVVAKLVCDLEGITNDCIISFSDLSYTKSENTFQTKEFGIGKKKQEVRVSIKASTVISIKLSTRDEDTLSSILKLLLSSVSITGIYHNFNVTNLEDEYLNLKVEACKKCRHDADMIVKSLGSEILGVSKVVYNSNGSLLNDSKNNFKSSNNVFNDACYDEASFGDFGSCDIDLEIDNISYDEIWAKGFVKTILDKKYTIEDSVTVVFDIK